MKHLVLVIILIFTVACSKESGPASNNSSSTPAPAEVPPDTTPPLPPPVLPPTPPPVVVCQPFMGTHWIPDGSPVLSQSAIDQSQVAPYVPEFDLTVATPVFTERQGSIPITCTRDFNSAIKVGGDPMSLVWNDTSGTCGSVAAWIQFDLTVCNSLQAVVRNGSGIVYLIQAYKPAP